MDALGLFDGPTPVVLRTSPLSGTSTDPKGIWKSLDPSSWSRKKVNSGSPRLYFWEKRTKNFDIMKWFPMNHPRSHKFHLKKPANTVKWKTKGRYIQHNRNLTFYPLCGYLVNHQHSRKNILITHLAELKICTSRLAVTLFLNRLL